MLRGVFVCCAVRLTGKADFYGPSYGGKRPVQARLSPQPFDQSIYMPTGGAALSHGPADSMAAFAF